MNTLMKKIGYTFKNISLLQLALTHPSTRVNKPEGTTDNQRLEFLGDAVLQLAISNYLYAKFPDYDEGKLTALRTRFVCRDTLVKAANMLDLGGKLYLTPALAKMGGRNNAHNLEDAFEALLAAIYLDGGMEPVVALLHTLYKTIMADNEKINSNSKGELQEWLQAKKMPLPVYRVVDSAGPAHDKRFTVALLINDKQIGIATEKSIKAAEQAVAVLALQYLIEKV